MTAVRSGADSGLIVAVKTDADSGQKVPKNHHKGADVDSGQIVVRSGADSGPIAAKNLHGVAGDNAQTAAKNVADSGRIAAKSRHPGVAADSGQIVAAKTDADNGQMIGRWWKTANGHEVVGAMTGMSAKKDAKQK